MKKYLLLPVMLLCLIIPSAIHAQTGAFLIGSFQSRAREYASDNASQSASDLAAYYGYSADSLNILSQTTLSDDPNLGFVGFYNDPASLPPDTYGIYQEPIAQALRRMGIPAIGQYGMTINEIKNAIQNGNPVVCWVIGQTENGVPLGYAPISSGNSTSVAMNMNTVTVVGFDDYNFVIWDNGQQYKRSSEAFSASWSVLGNRALLIQSDANIYAQQQKNLQPMLQPTMDQNLIQPDQINWFPNDWSNIWTGWEEEGVNFGQNNKAQENFGFGNADNVSPKKEAPIVPVITPAENQVYWADTENDQNIWFYEDNNQKAQNSEPSDGGWAQWSVPNDGGSSPWGNENAFPASIPENASINGFTGYRQNYNLDCETRSAVDLAAYFGVIIDHNAFMNALPKSDDPNLGFVGNYNDARGALPPASYGVYQEPVAQLLRAFGLSVSGYKNYDLNALKRQIAAGKPVMVWVAGNTEIGNAISYTPSNGNPTLVTPYQHTVIVIGYDQEKVVIQDGGQKYSRSLYTFEKSWATLENRAIVIN